MENISFCNEPNTISCEDNRCWLSLGCIYTKSCIKQLSKSILRQFSCACNFTINKLQAYQMPQCIQPPSYAPTLYPTLYPTLEPTPEPTPYPTL